MFRQSSNGLQVYDVTSYVEEHPGGDAILAHAGDDSTEGFYGYVCSIKLVFVSIHIMLQLYEMLSLSSDFVPN